jgi:hypothetical protein
MQACESDLAKINSMDLSLFTIVLGQLESMGILNV